MTAATGRAGGALLDVDVERRHPEAVVRATFAVDTARAAVTVLFGPSGAGKTTVLRLVAGLERPDRGHVRFGGECWADAGAGRAVPAHRRGVALVFQEHALFPHLTVAGNVAYGLFRLARAARAERVHEVARIAGVEHLLHRRPGGLSGGERQRVSLARALAPRPRLLLLDEPFASLDAPAREALRRDLRRVLAAAGTPALLVTHDREEALALGDAMVVLTPGGVRQVGPVAEVFGRPADAEVARAVGTENVLPGEARRGDDGLLIVEVAGTALVAVAEEDVSGPVLACIRAQEVALEPAAGPPTSARNRLRGTVTALEPRGALVRISLDCGFPLVALVTHRAVEELALAPGRAVVALVKAPAVRIVPHG
jgi:molybdate transport system ATP-binding protein